MQIYVETGTHLFLPDVHRFNIVPSEYNKDDFVLRMVGTDSDTGITYFTNLYSGYKSECKAVLAVIMSALENGKEVVKV